MTDKHTHILVLYIYTLVLCMYLHFIPERVVALSQAAQLRTLCVRIRRPSGFLPALYNFLAFNNYNL